MKPLHPHPVLVRSREGSAFRSKGDIDSPFLLGCGRDILSAVFGGGAVVGIDFVHIDVAQSKRIVKLARVLFHEDRLGGIVDIHAHLVFTRDIVYVDGGIAALFNTLRDTRGVVRDLILFDQGLAGLQKNRLENPEEDEHNKREKHKVNAQLIPQRQHPPAVELRLLQNGNLPL